MRVLELDELHEPFDVAQAAGTELEMPRAVLPLRQSLALNPGFDAPDLAKALWIGCHRVAQIVGEGEEPGDERHAAGDAPGAQQRLRRSDGRRRGVCLCVRTGEKRVKKGQ